MLVHHPLPGKPKYKYAPRGRHWAVYKMTYTEGGSAGTKVDEFDTMEEARRKVYELNGWNYERAKKGAPGEAQERR